MVHGWRGPCRDAPHKFHLDRGENTMPYKYIAKIILIFLTVLPISAQTAQPTAKLTTLQKYNPIRVEGGIFEQRLFQADALLRLGDAITTQRTVFDGTNRFHEMDPIAPGQNHSVWMAYGFQLGAHVAVIQGHNLLMRHHHTKIARALVIADVAIEAYTVQMNVRHEINALPVTVNAVTQAKPTYR